MKRQLGAVDAILDTSYGRAVELALWFAENGYTARQAIAAVNMDWGPQEPSWDDVVYTLAFAWRRHCGGAEVRAFAQVPSRQVLRSTVAVKPLTRTRAMAQPRGATPSPQRQQAKTIRKCLSCGDEFASRGAGNHLCSTCGRLNRGISSMAEGVSA